jgi:hypothetical protein
VHLTLSQLDDVQLAIDLDKAQYLVVSSSAYTSQEQALVSEAHTRRLVEKTLVEELQRRCAGGCRADQVLLEELEFGAEEFERLVGTAEEEVCRAACTLFRAYRQVVAERLAAGAVVRGEAGGAPEGEAGAALEGRGRPAQPVEEPAYAGSAAGLHVIAGGRGQELEQAHVNQSMK